MSKTEANRPVSSRNTVRYTVSVAGHLVYYQCKKDAAYFEGQESIVSPHLFNTHCWKDH